MRLLVECPECHRQYDATHRGVGARFRCHCGHVVEVRQPRGHEAQVVRCSACGAARPDDADECPYCGAEFTLHERDLDTVCPHCLARVSDQARFCHHCGTALAPEADAGADTELVCPACRGGRRLVGRQLGEERVPVLECGRCAGLWVGHEAFRRLAERARQEAPPPGAGREAPRQAAAEAGLPGGPAAERGGSFYRPCPVCGRLMNRVNYGRESGIVVDVCRDHGTWFDADELARVLAWLRAGGAEPHPAARAAAAAAEYRWGEPRPRPGFLVSLLNFLFGPPE